MDCTIYPLWNRDQTNYPEFFRRDAAETEDKTLAVKGRGAAARQGAGDDTALMPLLVGLQSVIEFLNQICRLFDRALAKKSVVFDRCVLDR